MILYKNNRDYHSSTYTVLRPAAHITMDGEPIEQETNVNYAIYPYTTENEVKYWRL